MYESGIIEKQTIDTRSGRIIEVTQTQNEAVSPEVNQAGSKVYVAPFATIDLNAPEAPKDESIIAKTCQTSQGLCALLQVTAKGLPCSCSTTIGLTVGITE